ncbi:hypothetical protein N7540_009232 [Penicillium herquei]|nr:hypothetical protein N7540_009232 [Penicillium herquei]
MASTAISFGGDNYGCQIGTIHIASGTAQKLEISSSLTNLTELEQPEMPPSPLSTIPFPRDSDFLSRDILLHRIHKIVSVSGSRVVLVGLGGVGIRSESPATWVFWVHASNEARFEQSFRDIADWVKIPGR